MNPKGRSFLAILLLATAAAVGVAVWYQSLDESRKRYVQNMVQQLPYLPARYSV